MTTEKLDKTSVKVWTISSIIGFIITLIIYMAYLFVIPYFKFKFIGTIIFIVILILTLIDIVVISKLKYKYWSYSILEDSINLNFGVLWKKSVTIPISRVQYVDTSQGILARKYNLMELTIHTAGGQHIIPSLSAERGEEVKSKITELIRKDDEKVEL